MTRIKTNTIPEDVLAVLRRSTLTANTLLLPSQLERKLYTATMKVIDAAGGRWSKKEGLHVFDRDPREALGIALEKGEIVNEKATYQAFYTPANVVAEMVEALAFSLDVHGYLDGSRVLEPSAGDGRMAAGVRARGGKVLCVEIRKDAAEKLRENYPVIEGDFLTMKPGTELFDGVLMNPPFTGDQDAAHILHAWQFLRPGGSLVAICSPRYTFANTPLCRQLHELMSKAHHSSAEELEAGTFQESGTGVRTMLITLQK